MTALIRLQYGFSAVGRHATGTAHTDRLRSVSATSSYRCAMPSLLYGCAMRAASACDSRQVAGTVSMPSSFRKRSDRLCAKSELAAAGEASARSIAPLTISQGEV
eukprot:1771306-Prymnesium_polylepis.2